VFAIATINIPVCLYVDSRAGLEHLEGPLSANATNVKRGPQAPSPASDGTFHENKKLNSCHPEPR
jgi:hypothetical protein